MKMICPCASLCDAQRCDHKHPHEYNPDGECDLVCDEGVFLLDEVTFDGCVKAIEGVD